MITETPLGWVAIAAFLVGLIVRLIKADGAKIVLANLGLPPIPTRALPWIALLLGGLAAVLDARVDGASWEAAAQAGVFAAALAVFGHELGSGVPGVKKLLAIGFLVVVSPSLMGCAWLQKNKGEIVELLANEAQCALANMNLPDEAIIQKCVLTPANLPKVLDLLGTAREEAARETAAARSDERAKIGARSCTDAGKP